MLVENSKKGFTVYFRILYTSLEPRKVLVFEDLKELGYFMFPRDAPDEYETRLIFSKLAQLHAATFKLKADVSIKKKCCFIFAYVFDDEFSAGS